MPHSTSHRPYSLLAALTLAGIVVTGCAAECPSTAECAPGAECPSTAGGVTPLFSPHLPEQGTPAGTWLSYPFPADHRRTPSGAPDVSNFPNPKGVGLLESYLEVITEGVTGFSPTAGMYLAFDGALAVDSLPPLLAESRSWFSPIQLIDITPTSEEYGVRRPLRWEYHREATEFIPQNTLAAAPSFGTPLRENTTYAFVVTTDLLASTGKPVHPAPLAQLLLRSELDSHCASSNIPQALLSTLYRTFEPLRDLLKSDSLSAEDVAAATVFSTGDVTSELHGIYQALLTDDPPTLGTEWQAFTSEPLEDSTETTPYLRKEFQWTSASMVAYHLFETRYTAPNFQHGDVPYNHQGGFVLDAGEATVAAEESMRLVISVPEAPPKGECYPVVQVAHGTGGDAYSFTEETAGRLAARGLAGVGIDQPLHGDRDQGKSFDVNLASFNFTNPTAARSTFRQGAIDTFSLSSLLAGGLTIPAAVSPTGAPLCLTGESMGFFGHSQGGLSGGLAAAFEDRIKSWVFSGAGGGLSTTVLKRKDILDFEQFIGILLRFEPTEVLTPLHPLMAVIQSAVDITDPLNYAPYWHALGGYSSATNVLLTSGEFDLQTPHETSAALALASRTPQVAPAPIPIVEYGLLGMLPEESPVEGNLGGTHTAGFVQWRKSLSLPDNYSNHFLIFNRPEAIHASMHFLSTSATQSAPVIERNPGANVR